MPSSPSHRLNLPLNLFSSLQPRYHPSTSQLSINLDSIPSLTWSGVPVLLAPYALLYTQAYLLLRNRKRDRLWRAALWPVAMGAALTVWFGYRLVGEQRTGGCGGDRGGKLMVTWEPFAPPVRSMAQRLELYVRLLRRLCECDPPPRRSHKVSD
jgi:hypothetical protein